MPRTTKILVKGLRLDLKNYRALPQTTEMDAVRALYADEPEWFESLLVALANEGFSSLEHIGVLIENGKKIVLEGNRRVAAMKILLRQIPYDSLKIRFGRDARAAIQGISNEWVSKNEKVPCIIFSPDEEEALRRIVRRTHGNDDKAGRRHWTSISKARESRDAQHCEEPELDLVESIIRDGNLHNETESVKWMSDFKFSIFCEAIREIVKIWDITLDKLQKLYENKRLPDEKIYLLDKLVADIGHRELTFAKIRAKGFYDEFAAVKRLPIKPGVTPSASENSQPSAYLNQQVSGENPVQDKSSDNVKSAQNVSGNAKTNNRVADIGSIRHCDGMLKSLNVSSFENKDKLKSIVKELKLLNRDDTPNAFALLLRTLIDIAFTEYCERNNMVMPNTLIEKIKNVYEHVVAKSGNKNEVREKRRTLQGALTALIDNSSSVCTANLNVISHRGNVVAHVNAIRIGLYNALPLLKAIGL